MYPFKFYSNFTSKNVSWLHFSWATQYMRTENSSIWCKLCCLICDVPRWRRDLYQYETSHIEGQSGYADRSRRGVVAQQDDLTVAVNRACLSVWDNPSSTNKAVGSFRAIYDASRTAWLAFSGGIGAVIDGS